MAVGVSSVSGIAVVHLLPRWGAFSDPFPGGNVDLVSWIVVHAEIIGALTFGAAAGTHCVVRKHQPEASGGDARGRCFGTKARCSRDRAGRQGALFRSAVIEEVLRPRVTIPAVFVLAGAISISIAAAAAFLVFHRPIGQAVSMSLAARDVAAAFHKRRLNFVVVGKQDDEGTTDTIILVHADLDRRIATLVSIPRDTWVAIPGHGHQKLNSAYAFGGAPLTGRVVGELVGTHVDATLAIDPQGAKQLVDALGGLNVNVETGMDYDDNYGDLHIHLKKGEQFLTGGQVLEYMRFRHDAEADWGRMRRQQQVVREIVRELGEPQNWVKIPRIVALARKDVTTSLNDAQLEALVELYRGVPSDNVRTFTLPGHPDLIGDAAVVVVDERWAKIVGRIVCSPHDPPQDVVLVANATGLPDLSKTVVGALRGGGWNVQTYVDEPTRAASEIVGDSSAARRLAETFAGIPHRAGRDTVLRLGTDARPDT